MNNHISLQSKNFFTNEYFIKKKQNIILVASNEEDALISYKQISFFTKKTNILYFPSLDTIPYDRVSPNQSILSTRAKILSQLALAYEPVLLITNIVNLLHKLPPSSVLKNSVLTISVGMNLNMVALTRFLVQNGFNRSSTALEDGEFAVRGEIIDLIIMGKAYRVSFSWDKIESIKQFNIDNQISTNTEQSLTIYAASEAILNSETINNFKENYLLNFGVNHTNIPLYESIICGKKFNAYEHLSAAFYNEYSSLIDYLTDPLIIYDKLCTQSLLEYEKTYSDLYESRLISNKNKLSSFYPALPPKQVYFTAENVNYSLRQNQNICLEYSAENQEIKTSLINAKLENLTIFEKLFQIIKINSNKISVIFCQSNTNLERLKQIIKNYEYPYCVIEALDEAKNGIINLCQIPLPDSFHNQNYLFISEQDIFGASPHSTKTSSSKRKLKNILTELDNLQEGELVVHAQHGIGQFIKVETIEVGGKPHDCLKLIYADNDRLYVPVENIELVKKYGSFETALDKLGGLGWQRRAAKIKERITAIAGKLLQLEAARKVTQISPTEFCKTEFEKFCANFQYLETVDQANAISDIERDLSSGTLMDRLICGDVGFGKTEVAMRAAFMVASDINIEKPQIALIVPTTILCKQHFLRFSERFKSHGFNVVQFSRLLTNSENKKVKEQITSGQANIIVGTHALLAQNIKFYNLRLVIIDEEQHFGVKQKEHLKTLKSDIHVLSLSATPIPRTLQMSMVGLKDLSIIATPPIDRLPVRVVVTPFDQVIIRDALLRERFRGGKSFYVCPKIKDIEDVEKQLKEIVPELKYKVAHGQMTSTILDRIMEEFYNGEFDILLSTTIIESGIDISTANTMIIHKADQLGLSQLYQLRGRIGRGKIRGYAYLTILNDKKMTSTALRRLNIIQNIDTLGAGFIIASHDMDLRGFGNLVGAEQSGHIKEVGVELYQEMLEQEIANLKNEFVVSHNDIVPSINLGVPVFIPNEYVEDSSLKLVLYKRIGNLNDEQEIEEFYNEMLDRFGAIPVEFDNLLNIVRIKLLCRKLSIKNLDCGTQGFIMKFVKDDNISEIIMKFINKYPRNIKIKPDNKLIFIKDLINKDIIKETMALLTEFILLK